MSNRFSKLYSSQLPGNIYQSAIESPWLVIESRRDDQIHFSVFHLPDGHLRTEQHATCLSPWHSLVTMQSPDLILQYFENKKNPDQVSFVRYNMNRDEIVDSIEVKDISIQDTPLPTLFTQGLDGFKTVEQFLGQSVVLGCEYQEVGEAIVISYYLPTGKTFERWLLVLQDGQEVYREIQDRELKGFAPGSFFTTQNRLIFVKEKTEINIYEI